ncbi:MAG: tRNA pseudouridine(55) synthase TruB [Vallitaleaceae bacterium]|nr:tRNA pseudouridine(55) synthase TruB [Vallitaleaceae bacterium]
MNGIINIYKEAGYTSFDVVAILRKYLHIKKIGHTGTLDPNATGVLPICIGKATKVVDLLTNKNKTYRASFRLGVTTDTEDIHGTVLSTFDFADGPIDPQLVITTIQSFVGELEQIPPMYSAVRMDGVRLYELARQGITVEREARKCTIFRIEEIEQINLYEYSFVVECSKGTYVRTLIYDIGQKLGCSAVMTELLRTAVAPFRIEDALKLSEVEKLVQENRIEDYILPVDRLFEHLEEIHVPQEVDLALYNGNDLSLDFVKDPSNRQKRIYDSKNQFIAIYRIDEERESLRVEKMFA